MVVVCAAVGAPVAVAGGWRRVKFRVFSSLLGLGVYLVGRARARVAGVTVVTFLPTRLWSREAKAIRNLEEKKRHACMNPV